MLTTIQMPGTPTLSGRPPVRSVQLGHNPILFHLYGSDLRSVLPRASGDPCLGRTEQCSTSLTAGQSSPSLTPHSVGEETEAQRGVSLAQAPWLILGRAGIRIQGRKL